jgi:hypothetical protein
MALHEWQYLSFEIQSTKATSNFGKGDGFEFFELHGLDKCHEAVVKNLHSRRLAPMQLRGKEADFLGIPPVTREKLHSTDREDATGAILFVFHEHLWVLNFEFVCQSLSHDAHAIDRIHEALGSTLKDGPSFERNHRMSLSMTKTTHRPPT